MVLTYASLKRERMTVWSIPSLALQASMRSMKQIEAKKRAEVPDKPALPARMTSSRYEWFEKYTSHPCPLQDSFLKTISRRI